ncbi:MAG: helix-turn-helix domain-containing protein [Deltaproteobacteria bacterium]|nr:helix-turn-helix domain-containing protein [Deltaproteobacteria bacterium]
MAARRKPQRTPPRAKTPAPRREGSPRAKTEGGPSAHLRALGARVRAQRERIGLSRRELAHTSGLSERFLADVELGTGNISVERLFALARALRTHVTALLHDEPAHDRPARQQAAPDLLPFGLAERLRKLGPLERQEAVSWLEARFAPKPRGPLIALLGLRGAGKSTIGRKLAERLGVPFLELDEEVERAAGLSLAGLFSIHGEAYYRRLARETLTRLLGEIDAGVIATGGGLVTDREAFRLLQRRALTVWLQATPEDHWQRVLAQGDERPGAASENAQAELRALLKSREPLYAQARLKIDTSRLGLEGALELLERSVRAAP